jgi:two-component system sensor histidine kinase VicK
MINEAANSCLALAELSRHGIFSFDIKSCKFVYCNPSFREYVQVVDDLLPDSAISLLIHPDDEGYVRENYARLLKSDKKKSLEFRLILPDQSVRAVRVEAFNTSTKDQRRVITGIMEDITIYKAHNDTLNKFSNKKNSLLNILSHDILGPLGTIQNLSAIINKRFLNTENQEISRFISSIEKISKRSISMVRNLLTAEFLETADAELVKRRTDIVAAVQEMIEQYNDSEEITTRSFSFSASSDTILIDIDESKLLQAINNLISNAIKFTEDNGLLELSIEEEDDTVLLKLRDNGIGIPEAYHTTLFEKFSGARREGLHGEPSHGLGMSIIRTIVEWHGGKIWFESQEQVGTTFYIRLPYH